MTGSLTERPTDSSVMRALTVSIVKLNKKSPGVWMVGYRCEMLGFTEWTTFEARTSTMARKRAVPLLAELIDRSAARFRARSDDALAHMQALTSQAHLLRKMPQRAPWWTEKTTK